MSDPVIEIRGLWSVFGAQVVHRELDLDVYRGEIVSIIGSSGSGKTTLLRKMLGLELPTKGSVKVFGIPTSTTDIDVLRHMRQRWGMLFQQGALYSALPVYDNVALPLRELRTIEEDVIRELVYLKLNMVGIGPEHASKMPANLSGGMVKRVALARALALEPELLFLDEPTAGLDPDRSDAFVKLIIELHEALHLTVVMVTHDLDTLFELSSRIVVLSDQRIVANGPVEEVVRVPHPFIDEFFNGPRGKRAIQVLPQFARGG